MVEKQFYSRKEVQEMLGISRSKMNKLILEDEIKTTDIGGQLKIHKRDYLEFIGGVDDGI